MSTLQCYDKRQRRRFDEEGKEELLF